MLIPVYCVSGLISTLWSIWLFILWQKKLKYSDTSLMRFILLLLPVTFFIIIVFSDWSKVVFLRVDIAGLIAISIASLFFWLVQVCTITLHPQFYKFIFIITVSIDQALNLFLVIFLLALRSFPLLAIRISTFFESWKNVDLLKVLWEGLDPEKNEQSLFSIMNKIFIALVIYFPLTAVRIWFTNRKFRQLKAEIDILKTQIDVKIEAKIEAKAAAPVQAVPETVVEKTVNADKETSAPE